MSKDYAADRAKVASEQIRRMLNIETPEEKARREQANEHQMKAARLEEQKGTPLFEVEP